LQKIGLAHFTRIDSQTNIFFPVKLHFNSFYVAKGKVAKIVGLPIHVLKWEVITAMENRSTKCRIKTEMAYKFKKINK